jgi:hypothetical protein
MRDQLSSIFSYLFMASIFVFIVSLFAVLIIFLRSFIVNIGNLEKQTGYAFLCILITCIILAPIFLYLSNRMEKYRRPMDRV